MEIKTSKKWTKKRILIIGGIIVLVAVIALGTYVFAFKGPFFGFNTSGDQKPGINYDKPTEEQLKAGEDIEKYTDKNSNSGEDPNAVGSDRPAKPVTNPGDSKATTSIEITSANQTEDTIQIRSLISTLTSEGTCTLTLTKGASVITKTVGVQALPSHSTCKGFDIPVSELSTGQWQLTLNFENNTLKGSVSQSVTVN